MVVEVAKPGRERRTKGFETGGGGDVVDAWLLIFIALLWPLWLLLSLGKEKAPGDQAPPRNAALLKPSYAERLNNTKKFFPFSLWATYEELEQYTEGNCTEAEAILDRLAGGVDQVRRIPAGGRAGPSARGSKHPEPKIGSNSPTPTPSPLHHARRNSAQSPDQTLQRKDAKPVSPDPKSPRCPAVRLSAFALKIPYSLDEYDLPPTFHDPRSSFGYHPLSAARAFAALRLCVEKRLHPPRRVNPAVPIHPAANANPAPAFCITCHLKALPHAAPRCGCTLNQ